MTDIAVIGSLESDPRFNLSITQSDDFSGKPASELVHVTVEGLATEGEFVPAVTNAVLRRVGWWNLEPGHLVSLEQALTGLEDGRWVAMRGFVRQLTRTNGLARFDLGSSSGEFQVWALDSRTFDPLKGAIIRVQGVCAALSNARQQLTGIQIWTPDLRYVRVEEAALSPSPWSGST